MKVKIENEGEVNEFNIIDNWGDVDLKSWGKLIDEKNPSPTKQAINTITALSDIPAKYVKALSMKHISTILEKVADIQATEETVLKDVITLGGKNYGFHPNLDELTIGEYADIESFIEQGFENNMTEIMAVLYRPIIDREGKKYTIEAYDGKIEERVKEIKKMKAKDVQAALVFFWNFASVLSGILALFSMEVLKGKMYETLPKILPKDGDGLE